ncbi:MAG: glycosyltransferase family 4 protein [Pseudomonadota bacterium]
MQLFQLAAAMQTHDDVSIDVVLLNEGLLAERLREAGVAVTVIDENQHNGLVILYRLISHFRRVRSALVHTHRQKENVLGSLAARLAKVKFGVRTVHGAPEFSNTGWRRRINSELDRWTARWLQDRIVMVTQDLSEQLSGRYPSAKVRVIENGLAPIDRAEGARKYAVADKLNVCFAGRLVPVKRVDLFVDMAAAANRQSDDRFHFHIFGDGPGQAALDERISSEDLNDFVSRWGFVDGLTDALAEMDMLVMTSDHEGLPMVMLEAMSLGVAVVAHSVGGMPEVLAHGECGVLVHEHTGEAFLGAIQSLVQTEVRGGLSTRAQQRFLERYTAEGCATRTVELYKSLVQPSERVA